MMERKRSVRCPICGCGKENRVTLYDVTEGEPYKILGCNHCLWDPWNYPDKDFPSEFIKAECSEMPEFDSVDLEALSREVLEAHRANVQEVLKEELHEVDGWWFGDLDERENACRRLAKLLRPLCNAYSKAAES